MFTHKYSEMFTPYDEKRFQKDFFISTFNVISVIRAYRNCKTINT